MNLKNKRFIFARHANAAPGEIDAQRELTEKGRGQAEALKAKLDGTIFDLVITSHTTRTQQTAGILVGDEKAKEIIILQSLFQLPDDDDERIIGEMFAKLAYANLRTYLNEPDAETVHRFGRNCSAEVVNVIGAFASAKTILVVGHAVLSTALIYHMFPTIEAAKALALETCLNEAGAIEVLVGDAEEYVTISLLN